MTVRMHSHYCMVGVDYLREKHFLEIRYDVIVLFSRFAPAPETMNTLTYPGRTFHENKDTYLRFAWACLRVDYVLSFLCG